MNLTKKILTFGLTAVLTISVMTTALAADKLQIKTKTFEDKAVRVEVPVFKGAAGGADIDRLATMTATKNALIDLYSFVPDAEVRDMDKEFFPTFQNEKDPVKSSHDFIRGVAFIDNITLKEIARFTGQTDVKSAGYYIDVDYDLYTVGSKYVSYTQSMASYTGGAHENVVVSTTTMNLQNGTVLNLEDIFMPGSDYKERLEWVIDKQQKGDNRMNTDLGKAPVDYKKVVISGKEMFCYDTRNLDNIGLVIFYNPGEVAPMSEGVIEYDIPLETVYDILSDNKLK